MATLVAALPLAPRFGLHYDAPGTYRDVAGRGIETMNENLLNAPARKQVVLRFTGRQRTRLKAHLLPGDGYEAIAVALCGRHCDEETEFLMVHRIVEIPHEECER